MGRKLIDVDDDLWQKAREEAVRRKVKLSTLVMDGLRKELGEGKA